MATVTAPIMTDATGQSIDSKLNSLLGKMDNLAAAFQPNASGIVYSNTTSGLTGDDVQEAIDEMAADVSEIKQSLDDLFKVKNLGIVTNLNLSSVTKGQCYWCAFNQNTTGAPQANSGGYCFTTINSDTSNYGRQIVISNTGIWTRARSGGSYGSWTQLA